LVKGISYILFVRLPETMLFAGRKEEIKAMQKEAHDAFKLAVAKVYDEYERTGETFPYLLDGKVVWITYQQLQTIEQQTPQERKEFVENLKQS